MYTNNKGFGLKDLIIKIVFVALFVLLLIWLFRNYSPNMKPFYSNVFRENISYMQNAAKSYFTNDELPTEVGKTIRLTLKQMEEMKLLIPFVDKDGKSCDINKSYADVTKEESGYTLKVNLVCGSESNYIIEILGCHDYCNNCNTAKTTLEYEFKRTVKKDETVFSCPTGYTKSGEICSKKTGTETLVAISNYTEEKTEVSPVLYKDSQTQKKEYTNRIEGTETKNKVYTDSEKKTTTTCRDVTIKDPNCTVQCKWVTGSNGIPTEVCNTCGYVTHKECTDSNAYVCPNNYLEEGSGTSLKCYRVVVEKTYSCPSGYTEEGSGTNLKCYKTVAGDKIAYCANSNAKIKDGKCVLTIPKKFSYYSCKDGYTLNKIAGTCSKDIISTVKATSSIVSKSVTETKWSREKTLAGWTATGKTRTVTVK